MSQNNEMADVQLKIKGILNGFALSSSETAEPTSSWVFTHYPIHTTCLLLCLVMDMCNIQEVLETQTPLF